MQRHGTLFGALACIGLIGVAAGPVTEMLLAAIGFLWLVAAAWELPRRHRSTATISRWLVLVPAALWFVVIHWMPFHIVVVIWPLPGILWALGGLSTRQRAYPWESVRLLVVILAAALILPLPALRYPLVIAALLQAVIETTGAYRRTFAPAP